MPRNSWKIADWYGACLTLCHSPIGTLTHTFIQRDDARGPPHAQRPNLLPLRPLLSGQALCEAELAHQLSVLTPPAMASMTENMNGLRGSRMKYEEAIGNWAAMDARLGDHSWQRPQSVCVHAIASIEAARVSRRSMPKTMR